MLKIKDRYKLKLQTPETIKSFGSTKIIIIIIIIIIIVIVKGKNGETLLSLEVIEVLLVQCNLADNQYQQKSTK